MKTLIQTIQEALEPKAKDAIAEALQPKVNEAIVFPKEADVVMISPNDYEGSIAFLTIDDIKKDGGLDKVLKLNPWESIVIDEDIYVMITDPSAID